MTLFNRTKFTDVLQGSADRDAMSKLFAATKAAADFTPIPAGKYKMVIRSGELFTSKTNNTPGYKLKLEVIEGEYTGRLAWYDLWLTEAAMPMTKRELAKIGIDTFAKLERPLHAGIIIEARLAVRCADKKDDSDDDEKREYNHVRSFEFVGIEKDNAFAPDDQNKPLANTDEPQAGDAAPIADAKG